MQEGVAMLKQAEEMEVQAEVARKQKIERGKKLLDEIVKANQDQAREKALRKQKEIEEDLKIAAYIRDKEAREAEYEAQQDAIQARKDNEKKKLREAREKANDHQVQYLQLVHGIIVHNRHKTRVIHLIANRTCRGIVG